MFSRTCLHLNEATFSLIPSPLSSKRSCYMLRSSLPLSSSSGKVLNRCPLNYCRSCGWLGVGNLSSPGGFIVLWVICSPFNRRRQTMKIQRRLLFAFVVPLLALILQTSRTVAQDVPEPPDAQQGPEQDPPTRVARLNYSSGSVSFQPGGEGDWVTAVQNRPLTTGDNLWADQNSRAELHVGSTAIRMAPETSLTFLDLDDHTTQLRLSLGTLLLRVRHLDDGDLFEVDTPNLAFTVQRAGEYRFDVNEDGNQTTV